tara:strand:+ start:787 stop:1065 length:279 start_codon:yes stop_codon:yes gene_type:complete
MAKTINQNDLQSEREDLIKKIKENNTKIELLKNNAQALIGAVTMIDKLLSNMNDEDKVESTNSVTPESKRSLEEHAKDYVSELGDDNLGKVE